jgi:peptide/nickel transport system substrate-binding protein
MTWLTRSLIALVLLASGAAVAPPAHAQATAPDGQVTWAIHVTLAVRWLDPAENEGAATPYMIFYAVHDALLKPMPASPSEPSLAESWSMSKDGLSYDFVVRDGVKFHNGDRLTADDVKFSFERYRGAGAKLLKEKVKQVQVVDPRRVRFLLKEPWPDFITYYGTTATSAGWIVPKKYVEAVGDDGFKKAPVGAGPYRVVSFTPGIELTLEAFEGYWRKVPSVKRLVLRSLPDETTRAAALKKGDTDIAYFLNGPVADDVRRTPDLKLMAARTNGNFFLQFPEAWDAKSPWSDRRVRLAASVAIDRKAINDAEYLGFAGLTGNIVPRTLEFALPIEPHPYDPKRARQLLADAGYPNGFDSGDFTIAPPYHTTGEAIGGYLGAVGIRTRIRTMERAAFFTAWGEKKFKGLIFAGVGPAGNAATRIQNLATKGGLYAYGVVPEVEDLFERQGRELDRRKREELLHQIQRILHEQVVFAPIWDNAFVRGVGPRVEEPALSLIPAFPYSAPYEEVRLKRR